MFEARERRAQPARDPWQIDATSAGCGHGNGRHALTELGAGHAEYAGVDNFWQRAERTLKPERAAGRAWHDHTFVVRSNFGSYALRVTIVGRQR